MAATATALPVQIVYNEMSENDKGVVMELVSNTLKSLEKSEKMMYNRDLAQIIKQELDILKGGKWNVIIGRWVDLYLLQ
jgi:hypothetical protein